MNPRSDLYVLRWIAESSVVVAWGLAIGTLRFLLGVDEEKKEKP